MVAVLAKVDGETCCGLAAIVGNESHHHTTEPPIPCAGHLSDLSAPAGSGKTGLFFKWHLGQPLLQTQEVPNAEGMRTPLIDTCRSPKGRQSASPS
jgi:hypothetical protein